MQSFIFLCTFPQENFNCDCCFLYGCQNTMLKYTCVWMWGWENARGLLTEIYSALLSTVDRDIFCTIEYCWQRYILHYWGLLKDIFCTIEDCWQRYILHNWGLLTEIYSALLRTVDRDIFVCICSYTQFGRDKIMGKHRLSKWLDMVYSHVIHELKSANCEKQQNLLTIV